MSKRVLTTLGVVLLLSGATGTALAEDEDEQRQATTRAEAERFFRSGERAYNAGQYVVASRAFEEAYEALPLPAIAFSTAQAYRLQYFIDKDPARLKRAIELYRTYVQAVESGGRRDDAVSSLAELEPLLSRIEAEQARKGMGPIAAQPLQSQTTDLMITTQVDGATAIIDGGEPTAVPVTREVEPGQHTIKVEADGYFPIEKKVNAVEGRLVPVEFDLEPRPAVIAVTADSGAIISVDGRPVGTAPLEPLSLEAGTHFIAVTRRGHQSWSREVEVGRGERVDLRPDLERTGQRTVSYWVAGAAGGFLVASGVYAGLAFSSDSSASDIVDRTQSETISTDDLAELDDLRQERDDRRAMAVVFAGVGAGLAATSLALYLFDTPQVEARPATMRRQPTAPTGGGDGDAIPFKNVRVTPMVGGGTAGLGLAGRF